MRKVLYFFLTPLIAVLLILAKAYETEIKEFNKYAPTILTLFLVFATFVNAYLSTISPYKILQETKKRVWKELDVEAQKVINIYKAKFDLSFNIMLPKRRILCFHVPSKSFKYRKLSLFPKVFKVVWSYGSYHVNSHLKFTTKQGSSGKSYRDENFYGYDLETMRTSTNFQHDFNLNSEQLRLTESVMMLASAPIVFKENAADAQEIKILGVINVECRTEKSGILITNVTLKKAISDSLIALANTYSNKII